MIMIPRQLFYEYITSNSIRYLLIVGFSFFVAAYSTGLPIVIAKKEIHSKCEMRLPGYRRVTIKATEIPSNFVCQKSFIYRGFWVLCHNPDFFFFDYIKPEGCS